MIDHIDRNILRHLKEDGRMTATALAGKVGLTVAPCHRRLRDLEASGVIRGYRADIAPAAVGLGSDYWSAAASGVKSCSADFRPRKSSMNTADSQFSTP